MHRTRLQSTAPTAHASNQATMLLRLNKEFGVDTASAQALTGAALDDWIEAATEALFEREHAEFKAQLAAR
ncbi:hypothetical protein [Giesbergeria anulus]|uniref:Uncharacterized protein n=1 Tax=Giesbergeria anulus TaxID=180197 RepID=A0A1H9NRJ8_9BURK|nr:hypothetical protein [Giesbergeria anulus]SER38377.1 hypothetical protein SAMN02982919_02310 [Giesbergeria anulus]